MRYKPLILALLLSFSLPTYAAKDAPKEKAAAVNKAAPVKKEKEAAKADVKKETSKKQAVKEGVEVLALNSGLTAERNAAHQFYQAVGFEKVTAGFALHLKRQHE